MCWEASVLRLQALELKDIAFALIINNLYKHIKNEMDINFLNNLSEANRYKIYILQNSLDYLESTKNFLNSRDIKIINLGKELSAKLSKENTNRHLDILMPNFIQTLVEENARQIPILKHKIVALENIGVLLEPDFDLNAEKLLAEISKNVHILILWSGQINEQGFLNWTNQKETFNFNLTQYEPKTINYHNEI
jgi:hypothetical protein